MGVWAVLSMFSSMPEQLHHELNGNEMHRVENIMTLDPLVHMAFDNLRIWFKPVAVCLITLSCTQIESCYRTLLIHTTSILKLVLDGYPVGHYPTMSPSQQQMSNLECLRHTILNYMHCAVRWQICLERENMWTWFKTNWRS